MTEHELGLLTTKEERDRWLQDFTLSLKYGHFVSKANNVNSDRILRLTKDVNRLLRLLHEQNEAHRSR
jgi:hypothetical protein